MNRQDFLQARTPLIGAAIAVALGVTSGLVMRVGPQLADSDVEMVALPPPLTEAQPIAWPAGKIPDYVIGTDFLQAQQAPPPTVEVATAEIGDYADVAWSEPPPPEPPRPIVEVAAAPATTDREWPSTSGDILDTRLPEAREPDTALAALDR
ncbi:MAG: hypothetical protein J7521_12045 [Caulobacter sp.]|nr:hypothetical protein [Caulobacter sp.]